MFRGGQRKKAGVVQKKTNYTQWRNYLLFLAPCVQSNSASLNYFVGRKDRSSLSPTAEEFFSQSFLFSMLKEENKIEKEKATGKDYSHLLRHREDENCWGFSLLHLCILFNDKKRFLVLIRLGSFLSKVVAPAAAAADESDGPAAGTAAFSKTSSSSSASAQIITQKQDFEGQTEKDDSSKKTDSTHKKRKNKKKKKKENKNVSPNLVCSSSFLETRDNVGATPLFLAVYLNNLEFTKILLTAGANPNVKTTSGCSILGIVLEKAKISDTEVLQTLLKSNLTLDSSTSYTYGCKEINAQKKFLQLYSTTPLRFLIKTSEASSSKPSSSIPRLSCNLRAFSCLTRSKKRCSSCLSVKYCSSEHQILDWKDHKKECQEQKRKRNEIVLEIPIPSVKVTFENKFGENSCQLNEKEKKTLQLQTTFIVKVQISNLSYIIIYNKARTVMLIVRSSDQLVYKTLQKLVSKSKMELRLYFRAFIDPKKPNVLNVLIKETFDYQKW